MRIDIPGPIRDSQNTPEEENMEIIGYLEAMINKADKINEGDNGIILKVRVKDIPQPLRDALERNNPGFVGNNDLAVKLFKVFTNGKGKDEFIAQEEIKNLIKQLPEEEKDKYADIPTPLYYNVIPSSLAETKKTLQNLGVKNVGSEFEILLMDYIEGEDLGTKFFRSIASNLGNGDLKQEDIGRMDYFRLKEYVFKHKGWQAYELANFDSELSDEEKNQAKKQLAKEISAEIAMLAKKGKLELKAEWFEKVRMTVGLINSHGVYHCDMHERNVFISLDGKIYLLDTGNAVIDTKHSAEDVFAEKGVSPDRDFVLIWSSLCQQIEDSKNPLTKKIQQYTKIFSSRNETDWNKLFETIIANPDNTEKELRSFFSKLDLNSSMDKTNRDMIVAKAILEIHEKIGSEKAISILDSLGKTDLKLSLENDRNLLRSRIEKSLTA